VSRNKTIASLMLCPAIAGSLVACDYVRPLSAVCESRLAPTEVKVTAAPVNYVTDLSRSRAELTEMASSGSGRVVHGLTHTSMRSFVSVAANGITNPVSRKHCLRPVIEVKLSFDPMTVYVSSEQAPGSCQFGVTMEHELRHVAVYRSFLETATEQVARDLREYFGNRIFYFDTEADARKRMSDETSERVGPFVEESMKRINELQAPLDTREEYDRLERACPGL
jgi:hypothetical protein